jgi:thymidylate synthase ThyX
MINGLGNISVKVVADSIGDTRITTLQLVYPRFILAELNTHRVFSRNSSSSRAIPINKMIEMVRKNPAMPIHWGKNQPGMQAKKELDEEDKVNVQALWLEAADRMTQIALEMNDYGCHKQVVNRILEPFQFMNTIVTSTEWDNFFKLRDHEDAQPEIRELAQCMKKAIESSTPINRSSGNGKDAWHLPYVTDEERKDNKFQRKLSGY